MWIVLLACKVQYGLPRPEPLPANPTRFDEAPVTCPNGAKLGTLEVSTPLLENKLPGAIYLAKPYQNPFGSLLSIYLAIEDEGTGIVAKLAGKVEPDPQTGQLTATFAENPQVPVEDVKLDFFGGLRASTSTPHRPTASKPAPRPRLATSARGRCPTRRASTKTSRNAPMARSLATSR